MGWTNIAIDVLLFFFVIVSILMCLVVLMQKSKQEGLGAAFGQGAIGDILGTGVSSFLVKTTVVLAALFFILSISLARLYSHRATLMEKGSPLQQELMKPISPASSSASPAPTSVTPASTSSASPAPTTVTPAPASSTAAPAEPAKPAK
jgi:preprotein translocase subunit SecG